MAEKSVTPLARTLKQLNTHCILCNEKQDTANKAMYPTQTQVEDFHENGFCPRCWAKWSASPKRAEDTLVNSEELTPALLKMLAAQWKDGAGGK